MKVLIAESSYPEDFCQRELDGVSVAGLLDTIHVKNELRYVLDLTHLRRAVKECVDRGFDVLHVSSHGNDKGIALANDRGPKWDRFVSTFQHASKAPRVFVMSSCCGASSKIGAALTKASHRPEIIFGSTKNLGFSDYAAAWAIVCHRLQADGVSRDSARAALKQISAVVHESFVYRR